MNITFKIASSLILLALILLALPTFIVAIKVPRASIGSIILMLICTTVLFFWWNTPLRTKINDHPVLHKIYWAGCILLILWTVVSIVLSAFLLYGMRRTPPPQEEESATMIILGCKVNGHTPSRMLSQRLNAAADYLKAHPQVKCIVSGGQGKDEIIPEAQAMHRYLVARGIAPERIYQDKTSRNTYENMSHSAKIIEEKKLSRSVLVVTNSFHQYRSHMKAKENNLIPYAVNAETDWWLYTGYFAREILALAKTFLIGG